MLDEQQTKLWIQSALSAGYWLVLGCDDSPHQNHKIQIVVAHLYSPEAQTPITLFLNASFIASNSGFDQAQGLLHAIKLHNISPATIDGLAMDHAKTQIGIRQGTLAKFRELTSNSNPCIVFMACQLHRMSFTLEEVLQCVFGKLGDKDTYHVIELVFKCNYLQCKDKDQLK